MGDSLITYLLGRVLCEWCPLQARRAAARPTTPRTPLGEEHSGGLEGLGGPWGSLWGPC